MAFTAAWITGSLLQTGHGAVSIQISGLAAPDARDPAIMIAGFVVLGGCLVVAGPELPGSVAPRLIQAPACSSPRPGSGVTTQTSPPARLLHNQAHNLVSLILYADMVFAQFVLARRFRS